MFTKNVNSGLAHLPVIGCAFKHKVLHLYVSEITEFLHSCLDACMIIIK